MIRTVVSFFVLRSIDRARPVSWPLRAAISASKPLGRLERELRAAEGGLRSSTAGLVGQPPAWLAPRTVARLPHLERGARTTGAMRRRLALAGGLVGGVGAVGGIVAAAITGVALLQPAPQPVPSQDHSPVAAEDGASSTLIAAVFQTRDRVASADSLANPLLAEAHRLRDDTQAAASFLLDRLRIIGVQTRQ